MTHFRISGVEPEGSAIRVGHEGGDGGGVRLALTALFLRRGFRLSNQLNLLVFVRAMDDGMSVLCRLG
jgi:hypothetical protein